MWWIRLAVQNPGSNGRLGILPARARTDDEKPYQPIDFTEILAWTVSLDFGNRFRPGLIFWMACQLLY
jgi:hypothetical protein